MKKQSFFLIPLFAISMISCEGINLGTANAFKGDYWMESTIVGVTDSNEEPFLSYSVWTPVSIYGKGSELYVQTEWFGAPYAGEHPEEIERTRERPDFISQRRERGDKGEAKYGMDDVAITDKVVIVILDACIWAINRGVYARSLPIKAKSGLGTVLNLEPYTPVEVALTNASGEVLGKINAWYEYGPMVKDGDVIKWEVELKDHNTLTACGFQYDRIIHRNILYKK